MSLLRLANGLRHGSSQARAGVASALQGRQYATEATYQVKPVTAHKLDDDNLPATESTMTKDEAMDYFHTMSTIRRMETTAGEMYREKKIRGFLHLYSGQEACAVGMKAAFREQDSIVTAYRCHGFALLSGHSVTSILAELMGKFGGCSNGKGGSMHMYGNKFYGGNGIVGAQVPVAAGIAMAHKQLGDGGVCFGLYGDGAANQGQVFEAYNIAALWDLPAVFVCENNHFGMGTHDFRSSASTDYYSRGDYLPGIRVDAMDVLAVKEATAFAIEHANTKGPMVMELETYRYHGHSMSDPDTTYRDRADIKNVRKHQDPITTLADRMVEAGFATAAELKEIEKQIRKDVKQALKDAEASGDPPFEQLYTHVLKDEIEPNIRGCDPFTHFNTQ